MWQRFVVVAVCCGRGWFHFEPATCRAPPSSPVPLHFSPPRRLCCRPSSADPRRCLTAASADSPPLLPTHRLCCRSHQPPCRSSSSPPLLILATSFDSRNLRQPSPLLLPTFSLLLPTSPLLLPTSPPLCRPSADPHCRLCQPSPLPLSILAAAIDSRRLHRPSLLLSPTLAAAIADLTAATANPRRCCCRPSADPRCCLCRPHRCRCRPHHCYCRPLPPPLPTLAAAVATSPLLLPARTAPAADPRPRCPDPCRLRHH